MKKADKNTVDLAWATGGSGYAESSGSEATAGSTGGSEAKPFMVPDRDLYEYAVVRYVPRVDRQEFINVGLVMMCKRRRWLRGEIWFDEQRLRAFDPRVDLPRLRHQLTLFERGDLPRADLPVEERYRWLVAAKSAVIQTSPSHPGIVPDSDLDKEFDRLLTDLVK